MGKYFFMAAAVFLFAAPQLSWADESIDRLIKDVELLKRENRELKERVENVEAKDEQDTFTEKQQVNFNGYADVEYDFTSQPGVNDHFRLRHLSLFFSQKVQKEWHLFSEIEWEDAPLIQAEPATDKVAKAQGLFIMEQMYIQFRPDPEFDVSAGRLLTPAGIWLIYHYSPYVPTMERPLHIRRIFPQYADGIVIRRSLNLLNSLVDMHLYAANGQDGSGSADAYQNKAVGLRLNAATDLLDSKLEYGGSYLSDEDTAATNQNSYGLHLKLNYHTVGLQSEYATRQNMPLGGSDNYWNTGFYAQGTFDVNKWTLAARWDWYNSNSLTPLNDHYVYTGAINYHFAHNVIGKAEFHRHEFNNPLTPNYYLGIVSVALSLGDL